MNTLNTEDLIAKVDNALETMCFVVADVIGCDEIEESPPIQAWIHFHNEEECGSVELRASLGFVQEVGSGLLGIDPDEIDEGDDAQGVLLELANVIAGEVVSLLGGENTFFELGIPSVEVCHIQHPEEHIAIAFDSMGEIFSVDVERGPVLAANEEKAA